jgi:hypothetical protein
VCHMLMVTDGSGCPYRAHHWSQFPVHYLLWPGLRNIPFLHSGSVGLTNLTCTLTGPTNFDLNYGGRMFY